MTAGNFTFAEYGPQSGSAVPYSSAKSDPAPSVISQTLKDNYGIIYGGKQGAVGISPGTVTTVSSWQLSNLGNELLAVPKRKHSPPITGTTYYINPVTGVDTNNGTSPSTPFKTDANVVKAAGNGMLLAKGTTYTGNFSYSVNGTAGNYFVIGVYNPVSGKRVTRRPGAATLNAGGLANCINISSQNYIAVDCLKLTGATNPGFGALNIQGTSSNCIITNCIATGNTSIGFFENGTGTNNVWCSVQASNNSTSGDFFIYLNNSLNNSVVQYFNSGIFVWDQGGNRSWLGSLICGTAKGYSGGAISVSAGDGTVCKVYRCSASKNLTGIGLSGSGAVNANWTGSIIQNNDTDWNSNMGMSCGNFYGADIAGNRSTFNGSLDGINPGPNRYGRNYEFFGSNASIGTSTITIRFNYSFGAWNFGGGGLDRSEGVGIGLDNFSYGIDLSSNYVAFCQGNGIQLNSNTGSCEVSSNILVGNCCVPAGQGGTFAVGMEGQLAIVLSPDSYVHNNTIVGNKIAKYGISESVQYASNGSMYLNNYVSGHTVAGVYIGSQSTEDYTINEDTVPLSPTGNFGNNSRSVVPSTANTGFLYYKPSLGSPGDSSGSVLTGPSFTGQNLSMNTPIGALHA